MDHSESGAQCFRNVLALMCIATRIIQFPADCLFTFSNVLEHCLARISLFRRECFSAGALRYVILLSTFCDFNFFLDNMSGTLGICLEIFRLSFFCR